MVNNLGVCLLVPTEHRGIQYSVVQTSSPTGWKWTVRLDEQRTKIGTAPSRMAAIRLAETAIDNSIKVKLDPK